MCGDCTKDNKEHCIIESDSGYYVEEEMLAKSIALRSSFPYPPLTYDLDVCIPSNMTIDGIEAGSSNT